MFTYMTQNGLWRSALDLHREDLLSSVHSAKAVLGWLLGDEPPIVPPEDGPDLHDTMEAWTAHEHALANYGAVFAYRAICRYPESIDANTVSWFAYRQKTIRAEGWPYSRPAWATDYNRLALHRARLVKQRPEWYSPIFSKIEVENGVR